MAGIIEVKDQGKLRIYDADNSHYTDIVVPSSVTANRTITLPDSSFTVPTANTVYTHPNHSGEVTSTADGATVIADNIVDEANLKISNTPTNGYMLTAQSGNTGGLTWAAAPTSVAGTLACSARQTSDGTVNGTTQNEIAFNQAAIDPNSKYNTSNGRYTPAVAGDYFVSYSVTINPSTSISTSEIIYGKIRVNGTGTEFGQMGIGGDGNSAPLGLSGSCILQLDDNDYVSFWTYSSNGNQYNIVGQQSTMNIFRLT